MTGSNSNPAAYRWFALQAVSVCGLVIVVGLLLWRRAGAAGRAGLIIGALAALAGSLLGGMVARRAIRSGPAAVMFRAMGVRLGVVVGLTLMLALLGRWPIVPLLMSVAVTHLLLLGIDSRDALKLTRNPERQDSND